MPLPNPARQPGTPAFALLSRIREQLRLILRGLPPDELAEAVAEFLANVALVDANLHEQGKLDVACVSGWAASAIRHHFADRR